MPRTKAFGKRPKGFHGTPKHLVNPVRSTPHSTEVEAPAEAPVERPTPVETASGKKLATSSRCASMSEPSIEGLRSSHPSTSSANEASESNDYVGELKGYRLVSCERLSEAVTEIGVCSGCGSPLTFREDLVSRRGLVSKLMICCTSSVCNREVKISDPYASNAKSLNARSVVAMRTIGRGQASLESFCGMMDMLPPVTPASFSEHNKVLARVSTETASENMLAASAYLHQLHGVGLTDVIDVAVTCDGTWSKRGFTATYGVVVVIAWESGQVLDYEIKSKRCIVCARQKMDPESEEFAEWWEGHQEQCDCTHDGSSPAMECEAATVIFNRSVERLHLR